MKRVYVDTNLLLSAFREQDENYPLMEQIHKQKHLELVTSTITICEMFSVFKREQKSLLKTFKQVISQKMYEKFMNQPLNSKIKLVIDYLLNYYNITILDDNQTDIETFRLNKVKSRKLII